MKLIIIVLVMKIGLARASVEKPEMDWNLVSAKVFLNSEAKLNSKLASLHMLKYHNSRCSSESWASNIHCYQFIEEWKQARLPKAPINDLIDKLNREFVSLITRQNDEVLLEEGLGFPFFFLEGKQRIQIRIDQLKYIETRKAGI